MLNVNKLRIIQWLLNLYKNNSIYLQLFKIKFNKNG
jgi:hypothetical protein